MSPPNATGPGLQRNPLPQVHLHSSDLRQPERPPIRDPSMGQRTDRLSRPTVRIMLMAVTAILLVLVSAAFGPWTAKGGATARSERGAEPGGSPCRGGQLKVTVTDGIGGAGHVSSIILAKNTSSEMCRLAGYPDIRFFNAGGAEMAEGVETPHGFSGGLPGGAVIPTIELHPGDVAAAVMEGVDIPTGNATTCPSYASYSITLPGTPQPRTFDKAYEGCSSIDVHPFVIGFNGAFPSGEVTGLAPACRTSATSATSIGPFVEVTARSEARSAPMVIVTPGPKKEQPYSLILKPGRYRMVAAHTSTSRRELVRAGQTVELGTFGTCFRPTLPLNVPTGTATTSTTTSGP
jgi:hypothetical protein